MKQKGFTLIELLVASALTVGVAVLATATLTSVSRLQIANQQGHLVSVQVQRAIDEMSTDIRQATTVSVSQGGTILATTLGSVQNIYCAEARNGNHLVRYQVPSGSVPLSCLPTAREEMTSQDLEIVSLQFKSADTSVSPDSSPQAIQIGMIARYLPSTASGQELRGSDTVKLLPQITVKTTVVSRPTGMTFSN